jgi:IMP dehydrogenase
MSDILNQPNISFDDVLLEPQYSSIRSRHFINPSVTIGGSLSEITLELPIISSPMDTVTGQDMAVGIRHWGGVGVLHRYNTIQEQCLMASTAIALMKRDCMMPLLFAAIGVSGDYQERAKELYAQGVRSFCIDIAHGHHVMMKEAISFLRSTFGDYIHIMAGNVATLEGYNDLSDWGASSVRVGIGGGSICSTRIATGHGMPTLQSVINCSKSNRNASIIADGGIRTPGDIVKALAFGANAVMLGSMLSGTDESPGQIFYKNSKPHKAYRGMASIDAQIQWRGHASSVEGVSSEVEYKGSVERVLKTITNGLTSGLSYSGAKTIKELQSIYKPAIITSSGLAESKTHINA